MQNTPCHSEEQMWQKEPPGRVEGLVQSGLSMVGGRGVTGQRERGEWRQQPTAHCPAVSRTFRTLL